MENIKNKIIKELLKKYELVLNKETRIVTIRKPVAVKDFIVIKSLLKKLDISDIRIW